MYYPKTTVLRCFEAQPSRLASEMVSNRETYLQNVTAMAPTAFSYSLILYKCAGFGGSDHFVVTIPQSLDAASQHQLLHSVALTDLQTAIYNFICPCKSNIAPVSVLQ